VGDEHGVHRGVADVFIGDARHVDRARSLIRPAQRRSETGEWCSEAGLRFAGANRSNSHCCNLLLRPMGRKASKRGLAPGRERARDTYGFVSILMSVTGLPAL
jgi:hypothetical protein